MEAVLESKSLFWATAFHRRVGNTGIALHRIASTEEGGKTEQLCAVSKETNKLVNDILVLEPDNVDGLFFSGFAAYNKGEKKKAITYWNLLLKQLPKDSLMSKEINKRIKLLQD